MISRAKRTVAITAFTIIIIILVNLAWWLNYAQTEESLEYQLTHRLAAIARLGGSSLSPEMVGSLAEGYLSTYDSTLEILDRIKMADSLSEVFVIDQNYKYLATTQMEADSVYYLSALNNVYIDSMFTRDWPETPDSVARHTVTESYRVGEVILKSAFVPLFDTTRTVAAVLGVEADVDYTEVLLDLKNNLYFSTIISVCGGLIFGFFFFLIQRRFNAAERSLFVSQSQANLGRMVAVVSHEVKNPLMIIRASAERLQKSGTKEANFIVEETDRLNGIVSGYLDFASGRKKLQMRRLDLHEFLTKIVEQFVSQLARDNVSLSYRPGQTLLSVNADPVALRQIIINLILNGAEAVKEKGSEVAVGCETSEHRAIIIVTDDGPGMGSKQQKMIFEPFYTTKATGSGLGLYYSRRLIRDMDGEIKLECKPGGPTVFKIILPIANKGQ